MAWVAVDKDGTEIVCDGKPVERLSCIWSKSGVYELVELPKGSIKKLIGRELTWADEPVELKDA